jgi:Mat/Ecp fimbriae major subunit
MQWAFPNFVIHYTLFAKQGTRHMLNKMKIVLGAAAAVAAMSSSAAFADTESATATVQILGAVNLQKFADMDFGTVAASSAAGTVVLPTASNTRTCTGVTCIGTASRARFQVTAATNTYVIDITHSPTASLTGPGAPMSLTLNASTAAVTFNSASLQDIFVGGTLTIGANQVAGTYNGSFNVTADYQ